MILGREDSIKLVDRFKTFINDLEKFDIKRDIGIRVSSKYRKEGYRDILILEGCKISSNRFYINYGYENYGERSFISKLDDKINNNDELWNVELELIFDFMDNADIIIDRIKTSNNNVKDSLKNAFEYKSFWGE